MDQVEVDGSYILINDFEDRKSEGEIFIYPIDISVDDGEAVMIMDREYFEAEDPDFEIISFEVLPTDEPLLDKLLVSTIDLNMYAVNYRSALEMKKKGLNSDEPLWFLNLT